MEKSFFNQPAPTPGGYREMWHIAMPLILSMGAMTIMQFTDRVFLARYSSVSLQAALPSGILAHTMICLFQSIAGYSGTFAAQYHGAKQPGHCVHATIQGLWLALASWPIIIALIPLGIWLMSLGGHAPEVFTAEKSYFIILMVTGIVVPLNAATNGYFMGIGRTRITLVASIIGCLINIVLDYALIFGVWGCPELGIRGAAYATAFSALVTLIIQLVVFFRANAVQDYVDMKTEAAITTARIRWLIWKPDLALLSRMLRFGTPTGLQILLDLASFSLFIILTGRMGNLALAASNIAFSINHLAFAPLLGMSWAAAAVVGQHQGARNSAAAEKAGFTAMRMGLLYMALIGSTFILFPGLYIALFNPKDAVFSAQELLATGRLMLIMMTIWGFFDSISIILVGALKGAGDTRFVLIYMALWSWGFFVPGSIWIVWSGQSILMLWLWLALYVCLFTSGIWLRWKKGTWKTIKLIHHDEVLVL